MRFGSIKKARVGCTIMVEQNLAVCVNFAQYGFYL